MKIRVLLLSLLPMLALSAFSSPVKSDEAAKSIAFSDDTPSPNPYVTDGLVAMWDAEWNVGFGTHDPESPVWVDLSGNGNHLIVDGLWGDNYFDGRDTNGAYKEGGISFYTCECIIRPQNLASTVSKNVITSGFGGNYGACIALVRGHCFSSAVFNRADAFEGDFPNNTIVSITTVNNSGRTVVAADGQWLSSTGGTSSSILAGYLPGNTVRVGSRVRSDGRTVGGAGYIYCVRLYGRTLSDAELAHNYMIDRLRFNLP